jgi:hypothetical protein
MVFSQRNLVIGVISSTLLHFILIELNYFLGERAIKAVLQPVDVEYLYSGPVATALAQRSSHQTKPPKRLKLTIPLNLEPGSNSTFKDAGNSGVQNDDWTQSAPYAFKLLDSSGGLPRNQVVFITALWRKINQSIEDNPFLSEYGHTGQIFFRFDVDQNGKLDARSFHASGVDNVLKVIGARAIRKALRNEDGEIRSPRERVRIRARFTWSDYQTCASLGGIQNNFLSFCHYGVNKRKSFSKTETASTYLKAAWYGPGMFEEIDKYHRQKSRRETEFDPFQGYRTDPDWNL